MTLATSLRTAARNLIDTFGNDADIFTYSSATKTESDEGDITVTNWGAATTVKAVDGANVTEELVKGTQGMENIGEDEKILRDDSTIAINDRVDVNSISYRVDMIKPVRTQDTLVIQLITLTKVTDTSSW